MNVHKGQPGARRFRTTFYSRYPDVDFIFLYTSKNNIYFFPFSLGALCAPGCFPYLFRRYMTERAVLMSNKCLCVVSTTLVPNRTALLLLLLK